MKCHGADGTGSQTRSLLSEIPDFTSAPWQQQRADAQLMASILDGKGSDMPPQRGKISEEQARGLAAHVRGFAPTREKPGQGEQAGRVMASFAERYRRLQEQQEELRRQYRELSQVSPGEARSKPSESGQHRVAQESAPAALGTPPVGELFRQRCVKCHGADGTGNKARDRLPEIPNFTNVSWQARRTDARLLESILDGKGEDMPPQRGKIGEEQVRAWWPTFAPSPRPQESQGRSNRKGRPRPCLRRPNRQGVSSRSSSSLRGQLPTCKPIRPGFPNVLPLGSRPPPWHPERPLFVSFSESAA